MKTQEHIVEQGEPVPGVRPQLTNAKGQINRDMFEKLPRTVRQMIVRRIKEQNPRLNPNAAAVKTDRRAKNKAARKARRKSR